jgi:hypothetical protein
MLAVDISFLAVPAIGQRPSAQIALYISSLWSVASLVVSALLAQSSGHQDSIDRAVCLTFRGPSLHNSVARLTWAYQGCIHGAHDAVASWKRKPCHHLQLTVRACHLGVSTFPVRCFQSDKLILCRMVFFFLSLSLVIFLSADVTTWCTVGPAWLLVIGFIGWPVWAARGPQTGRSMSSL